MDATLALPLDRQSFPAHTDSRAACAAGGLARHGRPGAARAQRRYRSRRELVYDSDSLGHLPWQALDAAALARDWAPDSHGPESVHMSIGLGILPDAASTVPDAGDAASMRLDRGRLVRALLDVAPNAWLVRDWAQAVVSRLRKAGFAERVVAGSSASLVERLRIDIERERDRVVAPQRREDAAGTAGLAPPPPTPLASAICSIG
ncbi:MAG: hypothetical protein KA321_05830 [Pseudomonadales bacterium]|nr:hypothetical protein [Pseudomonadales bacterium]